LIIGFVAGFRRSSAVKASAASFCFALAAAVVMGQMSYHLSWPGPRSRVLRDPMRPFFHRSREEVENRALARSVVRILSCDRGPGAVLDVAGELAAAVVITALADVLATDPSRRSS